MLTFSLVFTNKLHLSALLFIRLSANHLNKVFEASFRDFMTYSVSVFTVNVWWVVNKIKSVKLMLNNKS